MAVYTVKGGGGLFGALGPLAMIGGAVTGQPWLTAAGLGMNAANSAMGGDTAGGLMRILNGVSGGIFSPMANPGQTGAEYGSYMGTGAGNVYDPAWEAKKRQWGF